MKRALVSTSLLAGMIALSVTGFAADKKDAKPQEPPTTSASLSSMMDGARWGQSGADLVKLYNNVGGVFDKDYDALLLKASPGVQQRTIEADRDARKRAFENSRVLFETPTGYDSTPIRGEYTYKNRESVMSVERSGVRSFFFFFGQVPGDRLWKIYREHRLSEGGAYGNTFQACVTKLNAQLGVPGRIRAASADNGLSTTEVDWQDADTHLRALDRSRDKVCAIVLEHRGTLNNLGSLRASKESDPFALDPSIKNVTGGGLSDPNAAKTSPSASASGRSGNRPPPTTTK